MKTAIFAFSRRGCTTAKLLEGDRFTMDAYLEKGFQPIVPPLAAFVGPFFASYDALIFVGACGIAVRAIAPHVRDKRTDPAVLAVDELGQFVIPLLSGHIGGANALARTVAQQLNAIPVITTATDIHGKFSVDTWAAEQGYVIASIKAAKAVSASILERPVPLCSDLPVATALPEGVVFGETGDVGICISWQEKRPFTKTLNLIPRILHLGIGCRRGTPVEAIEAAVETVLRDHQIDRRAVKQVSTIDLKQNEAGLLAFCENNRWPVTFHTAKALQAVEGDFTPSAFVQRVTGVDNVCERAALLGADRLIVKKTAGNGVTVALGAENMEVHFG